MYDEFDESSTDLCVKKPLEQKETHSNFKTLRGFSTELSNSKSTMRNIEELSAERLKLSNASQNLSIIKRPILSLIVKNNGVSRNGNF
jgi:hypothetical protein